MNCLADAVDNLDAAVFSGEGLLDAGNRSLLARSLERWRRQLAEWEEVAAELEADTGDDERSA